MSTKTTFKRVALVAVAALGLGVLSSVAPANARTSGVAITLGTPAANVAVVGVEVSITTPITLTTIANDDTFVVSAVLQAKPVADTTTVTDSITAVATSKDNIGSTTATTTTGDIAGSVDNSGKASAIYTASASGTYAASSINSVFRFTPLAAGTYTFAVFLDGAANVTATGAIKAADTVKYISITAVAAPVTKSAITQPLAGSVATDGTGRTNGAVLKIQAQDAAGVSSRIDGSQQILVNLPSGVSISAVNGSAVSATTQYGLVAANFNTSGAAYINVNSATAGTYSITSNLAGSTTVSTVAVTFVTPTGVAAAGSGAENPDASAAGAVKAGVSGGIYTSVSAATISKTQTSTTITAFGTATAKVLMLKVSDTTAGRIFGYTGAALYQDMVATAATTASAATATDGSAAAFSATFTITHTALASPSSNDAGTTGFTVSPQDTSVTTVPSALDVALTGASAAAASAYWDVALPTSTYLVVNGGTITINAELYNQYAVALTGTAVTAQVTAGRNVQALATNLVTDASGAVTFTVTDAAPTSATTYDTVTFTGSGISAAVTINYVAALTATTMTTSPSATTTTAANPSDLGGVNTATATASTGRDTVTATLLDAAGVAIVGMPVTLTVPTGVELYSLTPAVAYTSATGVATWSVYTTKAGTYKFTATGGGLSKDFYGKWTGSNGRVVSVTAGTTAAGSTPVTIKVADAYGNGVSGVSVSVTATGGYFQGIALSSSVATNANGEIMVGYVGSGTVTATAAEAHMFYGAALVGTTAAAGFPAGVSTATATVDSGASDASTAADAAAEATDAANAATDAANAAAEAADAATAAAQDAADAVAALSAQVASLISGLKSQLTALTNLVIKIQKKVKA